MAYHPPFLSDKRKREVCAAFSELYDSLPRGGGQRGELLDAAGRKQYQYRYAQAYREGTLLPPPNVLVVCFERTQDDRFLFTAEEKVLYQRNVGKTLPDSLRWPDRDEQQPAATHEEALTPLAERFKTLALDLKRLAALPSGTPERERARRQLVGPAMQLYAAATTLSLEFPEDFVDLIDQLETVTNLNTGAKKRR